MPERPLLMLPEPESAARQRRQPGGDRMVFPSHERQVRRLSPRFEELQRTFDAQLPALRMDVVGAVPEQVLVLETVGTIEDFARAVKRIPGMEWLVEWREEPVEQDEDFSRENGSDRPLDRRLFLIMSNSTAMRQLQALWQRYTVDPKGRFEGGLTRFRHVFEHLRDVRLWGVKDRLYETGIMEDWKHRVALNEESVSFEVELWYRREREIREAAENRVSSVLARAGGRMLARAVIDEIAYHGILAELPIAAIKELLELPEAELVKCGEIMFFRPIPQAAVTMRIEEELEDARGPAAAPLPRGEAVVALLDGLPLYGHDQLAHRLIVDDPDGYEQDYPAAERRHGTAMASLILHGDLGEDGSHALSRPLYVRPLLRPDALCPTPARREAVPRDTLFVDLVHRAVRRLFEGEGNQDPVAPGIRIINFSIGDEHRPFLHNVSPLARLLDYLSYKYNVLFVVSAGNHNESIDIPVARTPGWFGRSRELQRAVISAVNDESRHRRLLSPAEGINVLTVGSVHDDASVPNNPISELYFDPYVSTGLPSTFTALGLGFRGSVKPEILHNGGRQFLTFRADRPRQGISVGLIDGSGPPGVKVASPGVRGRLSATCYARGTSVSAALVSRAAAHLYEVISDLRERYGAGVIGSEYSAVLIRALLVHSANWGDAREELADALRQRVGAGSLRAHLARFLGYGRINLERVTHCTDQRATLLGCGRLKDGEAHVYYVPLPPSLSSQRVWRRLTITLAYFSPTDSQSAAYQCLDLWVTPPQEELQVRRQEVSGLITQRGTVQHDVLEGEDASVFVDGTNLRIQVNCRAQGSTRYADETSRYGLAVTLEVAEGVPIPIYDEISARVRPRVTISPT